MSARPPDPPDASAFRGLFDAHYEELCRFVYRYVGSVEDAREIVQEVFLRLWQQRDELDAARHRRAYLYAIARNLALDVLRHRRVVRRYTPAPDPPATTPTAPDPGQGLLAEEALEVIQRAVDALPPRQRTIVLLRWREQRSYEEIAAALGISPKTVTNHVTRAFNQLRKQLADWLE